MMRYGIPAYRLPRDVLDGEIARIAAMGVVFTPDHRIEDLEREWKDGAFDAVFIAVGAHLSKRIDIPSRDAVRMVDALALLRDVERGEAPLLGRRVAIYGGGNTAMDAARTVLRLGYEPLIVYRRDYKNMTALPFEADEALEEGVRVHWLRSIASVETNKLRVEVMEIGEDGKPRGTGTFEEIEADAVVLAVGQDSDTRFLSTVEGVTLRRDGTVEVDARQMTGRPGLFAGGDMVPADRSVTVAVGHGKHAARAIDAWLRGTANERVVRTAEATFDTLHLRFFTDVTQRAQERAALSARREGFGEVLHGLSEDEARFEAQRCLSCGNCFECDGCVAACPEDAVIKLGVGQRYRYDYDRCTGCAICYEQCPCGAIAMVPEPRGA